MKIIIYGTGSVSKTFYDSIDKNKISVLAFADRIIADDKKYVDGIPVITREDMINFTYDYIFIASTFVEIYNILIVEYKVSDCRLIPVCYEGNHPLLEQIVLYETVDSKTRSQLILIAYKKKMHKKLQEIEMICKGEQYVRDKMIVQIIDQVVSDGVQGEICFIGKLESSLVRLLDYLSLEKLIYLRHSIEENFCMMAENEEQKDFLFHWEEEIGNCMENSYKNLRCEIKDNNQFIYEFGLYENILEEIPGKISFIYINSRWIEKISELLKFADKKLDTGGYLYFYSEFLSKGSEMSQRVQYIVTNTYKNFQKVPLIDDEFGMLFCKK